MPVEFGEVSLADFDEWALNHIRTPRADVWVVEDYIIRPPQKGQNFGNHNWNRGETLRLIGKLEMVAIVGAVDFHLQQPSIKPLGYGQAGMEYKKGKPGMHIYDAIAHGTFWINKNNWG